MMEEVLPRLPISHTLAIKSSTQSASPSMYNGIFWTIFPHNTPHTFSSLSLCPPITFFVVAHAVISCLVTSLKHTFQGKG